MEIPIKMKRNEIIAGAAAMLTLFVTVDLASAAIVKFKGTQAQVRAACVGPGRELVDSPTDTTCIDHGRSTGVSCGPNGDCVGSTPDRSVGSLGVIIPFGMGNSAPVASPVKRIPPIGTWHIPESLVEAGSDSSPASVPAPSGDSTGGASDMPAPIF